MTKPLIIAIDGPAASGKTTLGCLLARRLEYLFFDSGVMYRAVTWKCLQENVRISDEVAVTAVAERVDIDVCPPSLVDERTCDILVDGHDVTWEIRSPLVDANVSPVSAYPGVRKAMTVQQRRIGLRGNVVMVGRDIGTVVLPEADLKIYLDASLEERAHRRYTEVLARSEQVDYNEILQSLRRRDEIDSTREVAPLRAADDAIVVNSDGMSIRQVYNKVMDMIDE